MTQTNFKRKPLSLSIYCVVCILCNITFVRTNECKKLSPCSCDCDGNIIDLKDLANKAGGDPKFKDYASTNPDDQFKYSYNPCEPFSESAPGAWQDHCYAVAGCQVIDQEGSFQFYDIASQDSVHFSTGAYDGEDVIIASYDSIDDGRHTNVILQCADGETNFEAYGEDADKPTYYRFILKSPLCCFDSGGLSAGSVLIIIAVVLLNVYVIMGVLYNAVRNKASGAALFSHVILLKAIPGLVKDGSVYLFSGCRRLPYQTVK